MTIDGGSALELLQSLFVLSLGVLWGMLRDQLKTMKQEHAALAKRVDEADEKIKTSIADVKLDLARDYVPRDELNQTFVAIRKSLERIENKIDGKADK